MIDIVAVENKCDDDDDDDDMKNMQAVFLKRSQLYLIEMCTTQG